MRRVYKKEIQSEWQLLVDAPLSSDILDHSGNNNHFIQQSYTPTFNNNALYITGVNRGVTLGNSFFSSIWNNFKLEMDVKWQRKQNAGLIMIGGNWPNIKHTLGCILESSGSATKLYEYSESQRAYGINNLPTDKYLHFVLQCLEGKINLLITDNDTIIHSANVTQYETTSYGNGNLLLGGGFGFSMYWNGWIKNFKLYKHIFL